jgi:hypothetical protein
MMTSRGAALIFRSTISSRGRLLIAVLAAAWLLPTPARAQGILELSDGRSAIIPNQTGYLAIDAKDASIGTRLHQEFKKNPTENCGIPNHQELAANISFSAQKGKRALFDKGQFTPGIDLEPGYAYFREDAIDCSTSGDINARHGYTALYVGLVGSGVGNDIVTFPEGAAASLKTVITKASAVNVAVNRYFGHGRTLGFSVQGGEEWDSPGGDDPLQVCVATNASADADGKTITASDCKDRFVGPLKNLSTVKARIDFLAKIRPVAWKDKTQIGIYMSLSTTSQTGLRTVYNLAVGPTLHPKGQPSKLYGAFLIEGRDLSNANEKHPHAKDRWSARLYATLPF